MRNNSLYRRIIDNPKKANKTYKSPALIAQILPNSILLGHLKRINHTTMRPSKIKTTTT